MRTSALNRSRGRSAGFTLIEILVTLVIMGLLAGLASLSVGGSAHRQARDEGDRLVQVLDFARDEATLQGEEYGVDLEDDGYKVLHFDADSESWSEATERQLASHKISGSVRMQSSLGEITELPRKDRQHAGSDDARPEVLVLSSGEITAFEIAFRAGDAGEPSIRIRSDGSGTLRAE